MQLSWRKDFILAYSSKTMTSVMTEKSWEHPGSQEAGKSHFVFIQEVDRKKMKREGADYKTKSPAPINILPQARLHLLEVP